MKGYTALLTDSNKQLTINIKYTKMEGDTPTLRIVAKDNNGSEVSLMNLEAETLQPVSYVKRYMNKEGVIVPASDIHHYLIGDDGTETEVTKYEKSKELKVAGYMSRDDLALFQPEAYYEIFFEPEAKKTIGSLNCLWEWAKFLGETNQIAVINDFSHGNGFKAYTGLIYPVMMSGVQFGLVMVLTTSNFNYNNQMMIPTALSVETKAKLPTISEIAKKKAGLSYAGIKEVSK